MRTTIRLDDELLRDAKRHAVETGRTLTAVIEEALRASLARREAAGGRKKPVKLRAAGSGGLRPGLDLDDSAALLDALEGAQPPTR